MTNWTTAVPTLGACVHFSGVDTRLCSNWTLMWTPPEREVSTAVDTLEVDTVHAGEEDSWHRVANLLRYLLHLALGHR